MSTDHHLDVCTLKALKPLKKRKTIRPRETYQIKWESLADKEVRTAFADNIASKFKELPTSTEDIETEWCLFRTAVITSATNCCGRKCVGGTKSSEKRTPSWNQEVKEAIRAKKVAYKAWLANKNFYHLNFVRSTLKHVRRQPQKLNCLRKGSGRNLGERLDDDFKMANKVFWQTIRRLRGKRSRAALFIEVSNGVTLKDQDAILNRWKDYFSDFLNPVDVTPIQIHEEQVGEDIQITEADVNAVIKSLKTGKAPGEDDIRPEMLKAMNIYGVRWLTRVCKVTCSTGQAPKQWQTSVIIPIHKKGDKRKCTNYRGISLISVPGKVHAKCLEKKCREIVEPKLTDAQCGFRPTEAQWIRSLPSSKSLRSRGNMQKRSMHV